MKFQNNLVLLITILLFHSITSHHGFNNEDHPHFRHGYTNSHNMPT